MSGSGRRFRRQEAGSSWADLVLDLSSRWVVGPARRTRRGEASGSSCAEARAVDPGVPQQRCRTGNSWATVIVVNVTFYSLVTYSEQRKH